MNKLNQTLNGGKFVSVVTIMIAVLALTTTIWINFNTVQEENRTLIATNAKEISTNSASIDMVRSWLGRLDAKLDRVIEQTK